MELRPSFIDTETTGFHGVMVLMQAAKGDGAVEMMCPWNVQAGQALEYIEEYYLNRDGIVMFNATFDAFHIQKMYNLLEMFIKKNSKYDFMEDQINEVAAFEMEAVRGSCIKPYNTLDLLLHSKKGEFQSLMDRKDIRIRRVPYALAEPLVAELNARIVLPDMYFSRRKDATVRWQIKDIENDLGEIIPDLVDVVLKFAPSSALKALCKATGIAKEDRLLFEDVSIPKQFMSNEPGYAPFAMAAHKLENGNFVRPSPKNWYDRWPAHLEYHIQHWSFNESARTYAEDDIHDTRGLYNYFDKPDLGDDDSILACMVGATRWRGFAVDRPGLQTQLAVAEKDLKQYNFNWNSPAVCRKVLEQHMDSDLKALISGTGKEILEDVIKWEIEDVCDDCFGDGCDTCKGKGTISTGDRHPAALDAELILSARRASKKRGDIVKLLMTDRFHPDFKIIGAKSSRMSGTGGLNAQGVSSAPAIRMCFTMADDDEVLSGGDFDAFEVTIADATYNDPVLREDLLSDVKIHAVMGAFLSGLTYDEVIATKGLEGREDKYGMGKAAIFALFYGGDEGTLVRKAGVDLDVAEEAVHAWGEKYPVMQEGRKAVIQAHTCMAQPKGLGTPVTWRDPADYVESMFGFKRYFTLENQVCKALFELASSPPKEWTKTKGAVTRRDKTQTNSGATRSSLYGAAFGVSSGVIRAALNHKIQASGATPTKNLQVKLWDLQPCGVSTWKVRSIQVHDEVLVVSPPDMSDRIIEVKDAFLVEFRKTIPLLDITWEREMSSWAGTH